MPTLSERLREFFDSPQGKRLVEQGQRQLSKPENQQKAKRLLGKLRAGRTEKR
ncbi:hypothetical protein ODJ79_37305 [Actinoplanes sp. KI2]|uniref:hypothetical protein n=1 Tax=Actinoplanes sp. KI2 TaxID=2983315 RepID=UPI0021D5FA8D|nr:hypothetical protein [Actinoplanes sp. KI2]MCU7729406.1 hypothetical protein [Actinoplanes sp. KI2]